MSHIVFFSYARENLDAYLEDFFRDLSAAIQPSTAWTVEDERISFRDKKNLRLGEFWKSHIEGALQGTDVLVCITSVAYFAKEFCGKEYYFFDQRRRQGIAAGQDPPPVIIPVIWAPVVGDPIPGELPQYFKDLQQVPPGIPDEYLKLGLRRIRRHNKDLYDDCVDAFADAIVAAWQAHRDLPPLADVQDFPDIPNMFEGGDWQEAAGPKGWLPGPEVANFVFVAESDKQMPAPPGRYGKAPREWRPYHPSERTTILDQARQSARKQFKFREMHANEHLGQELQQAKDRKNLSVIIGDPKALPLDSFKQVRDIEKLWWEGTAMLLPCDDAVVKWDDAALQKALQQAFPTLYPFISARGPLRSQAALQEALELALSSMLAAVAQPEIDKKPRSFSAPPTVGGGAQP
jgi:hypothetical protein